MNCAYFIIFAALAGYLFGYLFGFFSFWLLNRKFTKKYTLLVEQIIGMSKVTSEQNQKLVEILGIVRPK